jgi:plasmid stabilization system protein ParE
VSLPLVLRRQARKEYDKAFDAYEAERPGLGVGFTRRVQAVFDMITAMPELYAIAHKDIRRALVKQFPYSVFYKVKPNQIVVIAVFHN